MKYLPISLFLLLCGLVLIFNFNTGDAVNKNNEYFRVHIRANSNSEIDQNVKYIVKDKVVDFVTPYLIECDCKEKSVKVLSSLLEEIEAVCNTELLANGFDYKAKAKVDVEAFPTRVYDNITLEEGLYDALIVELGKAKGDNWWCIVYPPLCFVNNNSSDAHDIQYQSYLINIIKKFFK